MLVCCWSIFWFQLMYFTCLFEPKWGVFKQVSLTSAKCLWCLSLQLKFHVSKHCCFSHSFSIVPPCIMVYGMESKSENSGSLKQAFVFEMIFNPSWSHKPSLVQFACCTQNFITNLNVITKLILCLTVLYLSLIQRYKSRFNKYF